jgi:sn-glycerol 3-phosphate transport system substrate-binding protein
MKSFVKRSVVVIGVMALVIGMMAVSALAEDLTVKFWHAMGGERIDLLAGMAEDFNKTHEGITVEAQYIGSYNETLNKTIAAVKAGDAPHVFQLYEIGTRSMIDGGMIMPVGDLAEAEGFDWSDYIEAVLSYYTVNGKIYSMPFNSSTPILYYNKTLFEEAGLDPAVPPDTWTQVREMGQQIMDAGAAEYGIAWNLHSWYFEEWHCVMGANIANNGNGREAPATEVLITQEASQRIMEWWTGLEEDKILLRLMTPDWSLHRKAFTSGQAAMMISSTSDVTQMTKAFAEKGWGLGTGFLPRPDDVERHGVAIGGGTLWMTKDHPQEELEAAWTFLKWMSEPAQQVTWHKGTGYFAVRKSAVDLLEEEGWFDEYPNYQVAFDQLLQTKPSVATQGALMGIFPAFREAVQTAFQKVYEDKATIDEALAEAAAIANKELEQYNEMFAIEQTIEKAGKDIEKTVEKAADTIKDDLKKVLD